MTTPIEDIPASSIPAARAWILDGIEAQLAGATGMLICLDEPGPNQPDDIICVGEVTQTYGPLDIVGSGGRLWLTEEYSVTVTISVFRGGDDPVTVFNRARQLADLVVAVVRSDPSLGGAVDRARPARASHSSAWTEDHTGRLCEIELSIDCLKSL
jgi:hypothetical protein